MEQSSEYMTGYRFGTFHKCNGRPHMNLVGLEPGSDLEAGYEDGWNGNEVRINMKEIEPETEISSASEPETENFLTLWCEWDFGQEGMLFESEATGRKWLANAIAAQYIDGLMAGLRDMGFESGTIEEVFDEGLAGFEVVTLIRD